MDNYLKFKIQKLLFVDRHRYHNISHSENYVLQFNRLSEASLKQNNKAHLEAKCDGLASPPWASNPASDNI